MKNEARRESPFYLGAGYVNPALSLVTFGDKEIPLAAKMLEVLVYLARRPHQVVSRNELIDAVWEGNYAVGEKAVTHVVWQLRQAFEEELGSKFIETVHRKGYQLNADVRMDEQLVNDETAVHISRSSYYMRNSLIALFGLVLGFGLYTVTKEDSVQWSSAEQVTDLPGREINYSISPNGEHLVFVWYPPEGGGVVQLKSLKDPEKPLRTLFSKRGVPYGISTWSPDSRFLAFARKNRSGCDLLLMDVELGKERHIGQCAGANVSWSPDGRWLAYVGFSGQGKASIFLKEMNKVMADHNNNNARDVVICCKEPLVKFNNTDFAWTRDSQRLAFTRADSFFSENIYTIGVEDKTLHQVTQDVLDVRGLAWTKDEKYILYGDDSYSGERSLYQVNLETGKRTNLHVPDVGEPVYSSDYTELYYYVRQRDDSIGKIELSEDLIASPFPVIDSTHNEKFSDYSSIKGKIAFHSDQSGKDEIWISNIDGSKKQQLTQSSHQARYPAWSPSGQYIAYLGIDEHEIYSQIYILNTQDLSVSALETSFQDHGIVRWTNNDRELLVPIMKNGQSNIWHVPVNGETPVQLTHNGAYFGRLSPDERYLYYFKAGTERWLYRMEYPQGTEERALQQAYISWGGWDISSNDIIYINHSVYHDQVEIQKFDGSEKQVYAKLPKRLVSSDGILRYVEDEKLLLFTRRERQQIDIMKLEDPHVSD